MAGHDSAEALLRHGEMEIQAVAHHPGHHDKLGARRADPGEALAPLDQRLGDERSATGPRQVEDEVDRAEAGCLAVRQPARQPLRVHSAGAIGDDQFAVEDRAGLDVGAVRPGLRRGQREGGDDLARREDRLEAEFNWNTALFEEPTILRLAADFERLLRAGVADPGTRLLSFTLDDEPAAAVSGGAPSPRGIRRFREGSR